MEMNFFFNSGHRTLFVTISYLNMYAVFTNPDPTQPVICARQDCKIKTFPPGTQLEYIHSAHPDQVGRFVCKECCAYYAVKMAAIIKGSIFTHRCCLQCCSLGPLIFSAEEPVLKSSIVPKQSVQAMVTQAQQGRT